MKSDTGGQVFQRMQWQCLTKTVARQIDTMEAKTLRQLWCNAIPDSAMHTPTMQHDQIRAAALTLNEQFLLIGRLKLRIHSVFFRSRSVSVSWASSANVSADENV